MSAAEGKEPFMKKMDRAQQLAEALVAQMTLEEAASQLFYISPAIDRLGIPAYNWWNEGLHGVARAGTATMFPQAIGLAAMFDPEQLRKAAEVIALETRAKYNENARHGDRDIYKGLTLWSPNINIFRDPRWGRGQETYGEDPYLTSRLGCAFVKGLQGEGEYELAAGCAKHFAVHSGPENIRHSFDAVCSPKDMEETYLPAFEALVTEAKVEGVMGAYNRVNGEGACASLFLQKKLKEWGFEGYFTSDAWALRDFYTGHGLCEDIEHAAALGLSRGCDTNCGNTYPCLMSAYEKGLVTEEEIRTACVHLFRTRFRLGTFDKENGFEHLGLEDVCTKESRETALECARRSIVLLKNDGILPLDKKKLKSVAVIGPNADSIDALRGNYFGTAQEFVTFLSGIRKELGEDVRLFYSEGADLFKDRVEPLAEADDRIAEAVTMAEHADVTVLCLGLNATVEGEEGDTGNAFAGGDKLSLELPESQQRLMEKVLATGRPVIVVMAVGSSIHPHAEKAAAVLQAWYPGETGGTALADILFGKVSPSAKLPVTFYESVEALPSFTDYSMAERTYKNTRGNVLYPFGYGLTYSSCRAVSLGYEAGSVKVAVQNAGKADTEDVLEVYVKDMLSPDEVRNFRLCAFKRLALKAGESLTVELPLDKNAFTVVGEDGVRRAGSCRYTLWAGFSGPDAISEKLTGEKCVSLELTL